jgi:sugar phosphate isomerase/epimerase
MKLNLGARLHDFNKAPLEQLAKTASEKGFTAIQLALAKSLPDINSSLGSLSPGLGRYVSSTLNKYDIDVAVFGCYAKLAHPDETTKRKNIERFKEHIRFCRDFGSSIVATETFTISGTSSSHPDDHGEMAFNEIAKSISELVCEAEKFGIIVGVEAVSKHIINNAERMKRLIDTIGSNNLQIVFDPVNLLTMDNYQKQEDVFKEYFDLLGDRIVAMHAKDYQIIDGDIKTVPVGKGLMNYESVFKLIKPNKPHMNVLLEATLEEYMDDSKAYLDKIFDTI